MAGAGFKDFTAGEVLTSSDVDTYLMQQAVMVFASTAARDAAITSPSEGMVTYQTDTNLLTQYSGAAWSTVGPTSGVWRSWTSTLTNFSTGTVVSKYMRVGRMITYKFSFTHSSGTMGTNPIFSVPVAASVQGDLDLNVCRVTDASPFNRYIGWAVGATTSTVQVGFQALDTYTSINSTTPMTWASGDTIFVSGTYEAAADA